MSIVIYVTAGLLWAMMAGSANRLSDRMERNKTELRADIQKVWHDLQFTDYDHRVDICHLQFETDPERKERCVLTAYRAYCETTGSCTNYRRGK